MSTFGQRILWQRARDYLERYQPTIVGIAGSTGKTMVKAGLKLALEDKHRIRAASFSYRTRAGVAHAILGVTKEKVRTNWLRLLSGSRIREFAEAEPSIIALELGAARPGDIDYFARTMSFAIGLVTNVHSTNLSLFGNKDMIAHEQTSLISALPPDGIACLNTDDPLVIQMAEHTKAQVIWFGESPEADIRLVRAQRLPSLGYACELAVRGAPLELHLPNIIARHQLSNIIAVLAIVMALKGDVKHAAGRLGRLKPPPGRMRLLAGRNNARLLDDSYNASPESMLAALDTFAELPARGRRIAILGDIDNLGARESFWHEKIGERAAAIADVFVVVGTSMPQHAGAAALRQGSTDIHRFKDSRNVGKWLSDFLQKNDLTLIAGSRAMHMEEVVRRLLANPERDTSQLVQS